MSRDATVFIPESRMKGLLALRVASAAMILCALAFAVHFGGPVAPTVLATQAGAGIAGLGFWTVAGCIACLAGFLLGAGTTIVGLAAFLALHPQLAILCAATCVAAVS